MNLARHHGSESIVDQPVPLKASATGKSLGLDSHDKVPGAVAGARVAGMARTVILHRHVCRGKG